MYVGRGERKIEAVNQENYLPKKEKIKFLFPNRTISKELFVLFPGL